MRFRVGDPAGLHARPASLVAEAAGQHAATVTVSVGERSADAASVIELIALGAAEGTVLEVSADLADGEALAAVAAAIETSGLGCVVTDGVTDGADVVTDGGVADGPGRSAEARPVPIWSPDLLVRTGPCATASDAIREVGSALVSLGVAPTGYLDAILAREAELPTGVPADPPFALAHTEASGADRLAVAIGVLPVPVGFGRMDDPEETLDTRLVVVLAVPERTEHGMTLADLLKALAAPPLAADLVASDSVADMWRLLEAAGLAGEVQSERADPTGYHGIPVASGIGVGPVLSLDEELDEPDPAPGTDAPLDVAAEHDRLGNCVEQVARRWRTAAEEARDADRTVDAEILQMYAGIAADRALLSAAGALIEQGRSAESAVRTATERLAERVADASASGYLAGRAEDIRGVGRALVRALRESPIGPDDAERGETGAPTSCVLVGRGLSGIDIPIDRAVAAVVDRAGSATSHLAFVCASRGIPAVVGVETLPCLDDGTVLAVDGDQGSVLVDPDDDAVETLVNQEQERRTAWKAAVQRTRDIDGTADGHRVEFAANAAGVADAVRAVEAGAAGVGLLRTELAFADWVRRPGVAEQQALYEGVLEALAGGTLVLRTFDFGTDKPARFLPSDQEPNPALGVRGIRVDDRHPGLLDDQLQAITRAAAAFPRQRIGVMAPMVSGPEDARRLVDRVRAADPEGRLQVGVMIEVPAAVMLADLIAAEVDFLSIGTNDLTQYLHAADRLNANLAPALHDPSSLAVLRAVDRVCCAGREHGAWVGACGEAAGDPDWAVLAVGLGVTELSMTPRRLPEVREHLHGITLAEATARARKYLDRAAGRKTR